MTSDEMPNRPKILREKVIMVSDKSDQTAVYELPLPREITAGAEIKGVESTLPESLLVHSVLWFCRFRWVVIAALVSYGVLGLFPVFTDTFHLRPPGAWPFVTAAILTISNLAFLFFVWAKSFSVRTIFNLWCQIITDLLILTVVIYFVGSLETSIAFTYLFHIVLSCVFLPRKQSLIVTLVAIVMFAACIAAEYIFEILPPMSIFAVSAREQVPSPVLAALAVDFLFAVGIWLVVWYLASYLSLLVRQRDFELDETNRRLIAAQKERSQHMLSTTHQLKAPFAAIYSNAQLLLDGYCGDLSDEARQVTRRITSRCRRLTAEIQEMLQLANLGSASQQAPAWTRMGSTELLLWCKSQVEPIARERGIDFKVDLKPVPLLGSEDHFKMLFINLLSNAVIYSYNDGCVFISCRRGPNSEPVITIADEGIGIPAEKLPNIFQEHYRTKEAVRHNKESSGLGLAIVKYVAEMYKIHIRVESRPGLGTKFELTFPVRNESSDNETEGE